MTSKNFSANLHQLSPTANFPLKKRRGRITRLIESRFSMEVDTESPLKDMNLPKENIDNPLKQKTNVIVSRKKGRPRKNDHSNKVSRKRGRPCKNDHSNEMSEEIPSKKGNEISMNKKSGRSPKPDPHHVSNFSKIDKLTNTAESSEELVVLHDKENVEVMESGCQNKQNSNDTFSKSSMDVSDTINVIKDTSDETSKNTEDIPTKRRGRPRKTTSEPLETDVNTSSSSVDKTTESSVNSDNLIENSSSHDRSLNCLRKLDTLSFEQLNTSSYSDLTSESLSSNNVVAEIPEKRRGRKKGVKYSIVNINKTQCDKNTVQNKTSKKVGRPKKRVNVEDINSSYLAKVFLSKLHFHDNILQISFKKKPQNVVLDFLDASD